MIYIIYCIHIQYIFQKQYTYTTHISKTAIHIQHIFQKR